MKKEIEIIKPTNRILPKASLLFMLISLFSSQSFAQKFTAQTSKNKVSVGEVFQIAFTINTSASNFKAPNLSDFDVYSGPNQSSSMQIVNGSMSQSISLSYMLSAKKEGKFTIGAASIVVNGTKLESNVIPIEVKGAAQQNNQNNTQNSNNAYNPYANQQNTTATTPQYSSDKSNDDVFIRTFVTKKSCYIDEQIVVTQKVYSRLNLRGFQNYKMPSYNGFWSQNENQKNKQIELGQENIDGVMYYVAEFTKSYLFPQRAGQLTIEPMEIDCIVRKRSGKQPQNIFEQFFGGGGYEDVVVKAKSKAITIDVKALPEKDKPANFSGAVGNFSLKAEISKEKVKANESINLKLSVAGKGNIKITDAPKITFPDGFETYEPKITENYNEGGSFSGTKTYDYLLIPRKPGEFVIKDLDFSYFDPEKKTYVHVPAPEFNISVSPDPNGSNATVAVDPSVSKTSVEAKENDIRYLKTKDIQLEKADTFFFSSWKHYALMALPILLFAGFVVTHGKMQKLNSDIVAVKERKAAKLARKQLVKAEVFKKQNDKDAFYQEISIALNSYISNKLNIPVAELSKENIELQLSKKQVPTETISKLISTLNDCDVARYAPAAVSNDINVVYNNTVELITKIEDETKA
ncbi:MAG: protein BatD [Bacteroidetes bacterium]|nr:protein BatD [Bacteroidota bacterium]